MVKHEGETWQSGILWVGQKTNNNPIKIMDMLESFHADPYDGSSHSLNSATVMFLDNSRVFPALTDEHFEGKIGCICECFSNYWLLLGLLDSIQKAT